MTPTSIARVAAPSALPLALALFCAGACHTSADPAQSGWKSLFDGKTLQGWTTHGGRYDGDALWTVEDGAITGRQSPKGGGGLIYTEALYDDCDFACEFRIDEPMDSGVFLRMVPDEKGMQVTIDDHDDGELGGLYADGWVKHNPEGWKLFKQGAWNQLEISCSGPTARGAMEIDARINGQPLVAHVLPAGTIGYAPAGRIGLQVHGGQGMSPATRVQFRELRARTRAFANAGPAIPRDGLTHTQMLAGWRSLFDGASLEGWEIAGPAEGVEAKDGLLRLHAGDGDVHTKADYTDFELALEFRTSALANSGVFLRAARDGSNPAYSGCEIQILDDFHWEAASGTKLKEWQFTGSLYGSVPPATPATRAALRPNGEWNSYHITYKGSQLRVELNGELLYDVDTLKVAGDPPFAKRAATGFLGLQRHGGAQGETPTWVEFKNLFVRRL